MILIGLRLFIFCVWLYILSLNSSVSLVHVCVYVNVSYGSIMNIMCVLAGDIASVERRKASG